MANIERPIWSADGQTLSNVLVDNKSATYNITSTWYDGSPMDDSKLDNDLVYVKYDGEYLVRNLEEGQVLQKDTMNDMRNLSTLETLLLKMGIYKHVQLNGYYEKGDTPEPINYELSDTSLSDDGGSVVEVGDVKLEWKIEGYLDVRYYGIVGDGETDWTDKIQHIVSGLTSINVTTLSFPKGEYIVKGRVYIRIPVNIKGEGISNTIINYKESAGGFRFINPVESNFTINEDIKVGDTFIKCDTSGMSEGMFIRVNSFNSIRRHWGHPPTDDLTKWSEGEMFKILEVKEDGILLTEGSYFEYSVEDIRTSTYFSMLEGGSLDGIHFKTSQHSDVAGIGFRIIGVQNYSVGSVKVEGFNFVGVQVNASYNITIDKITSIGGSHDLGLNYGIMVTDGSKYVQVNHVNGFGNRHTVAGGGSGWAIPMKISFNKVEHESHKELEFHGVDAHPNCAQWYFNSITSTHGISICGLDHVIDNSTSLGGAFYLAYSGGRNIRFGKVYHKNPERYLTQSPINDLKIDQLIIECDGNTLSSGRWTWNPHTNNTYIKHASFINTNHDRYESDQEATSDSPQRLDLGNNYNIESLIVKGFGRIYFFGNNIRIGRLYIEDCGWTGSHSPFNQGALTIPASSEYGVDIGDMIISNKNKNLSFNTSAITFTTSSTTRNISIRGIHNKGDEVIFDRILRLSPSNDMVNLENITAKGEVIIGNVGSRELNIYGCKYLTDVNTLTRDTSSLEVDGMDKTTHVIQLNGDSEIKVKNLNIGADIWVRLRNSTGTDVNVTVDVTNLTEGSATQVKSDEAGYLNIKNLGGSYMATLYVKKV